MTKIRLEVNKIKILKCREKWALYFLVIIDNPENGDSKIIFTYPEIPYETSKHQDNNIVFNSGKKGEQGRILISMNMPENKEIRASVYVFHSRDKSRNLGTFAEEINKGVGKGIIPAAVTILGLSNPARIVAASSVKIILEILKKQKDKQLGCICADNDFSDDEITPIPLTKMSDEIEMEYVWVVK
jgi:hypothetical protein